MSRFWHWVNKFAILRAQFFIRAASCYKYHAFALEHDSLTSMLQRYAHFLHFVLQYVMILQFQGTRIGYPERECFISESKLLRSVFPFFKNSCCEIFAGDLQTQTQRVGTFLVDTVPSEPRAGNCYSSSSFCSVLAEKAGK